MSLPRISYACVMAMENVYLNAYRKHVYVSNYTHKHKEVCARRVIIADLSPLAADSKIPAIFRIMPE